MSQTATRSLGWTTRRLGSLDRRPEKGAAVRRVIEAEPIGARRIIDRGDHSAADNATEGARRRSRSSLITPSTSSVCAIRASSASRAYGWFSMRLLIARCSRPRFAKNKYVTTRERFRESDDAELARKNRGGALPVVTGRHLRTLPWSMTLTPATRTERTKSLVANGSGA